MYKNKVKYGYRGKYLGLAGRSSTTYPSMTFEIRDQYKFDPVADNLNLGKVSVCLRFAMEISSREG